MRTTLAITVAAGIALLLAMPTIAQEMRGLTRIPSAAAVLKDAPEGAELPEKFERVARSDVQKATGELSDAWADQDLSGQIGEGLYDGERLAQNMDIRVPHDANLRVEGVRSIQTNGQFIMRDADGGRVRVSTVTATVSTVATANDPAGGLVRLPGVNRLTFQVTEKLD